jgi:hypothetical protein
MLDRVDEAGEPRRREPALDGYLVVLDVEESTVTPYRGCAFTTRHALRRHAPLSVRGQDGVAASRCQVTQALPRQAASAVRRFVSVESSAAGGSFAELPSASRFVSSLGSAVRL